MEFKCYYCEDFVKGKEYLEVVFKGQVIGYICKRCRED